MCKQERMGVSTNYTVPDTPQQNGEDEVVIDNFNVTRVNTEVYDIVSDPITYIEKELSQN